MATEKILQLSKALGDETRLQVFRYLATRNQPVTVQQVAAAMQIHPNAARAHLRLLESNGLAVSELDHEAPTGRPPRRYRAANQGLAPIFAPAAFRALAGILLELVAEQPALDAAALEEFGQRFGRRHASRYPTDGTVAQVDPDFIRDGLLRTLEGWGFGAVVEERAGQRGVLVSRCPFADLASRHGEQVCPLIHGILQGMLETVRPDLRFAPEPGEGHPGRPCWIGLLAAATRPGTSAAGRSRE
ncbi:MAG: helix-turn-helix domain-containing protein [Myxococcota bacterium]|jgi:predicted ArsR family transcriptional regulator|nr:helix-turn-helix domain-containing protein [Myxococcota bacterium]